MATASIPLRPSRGEMGVKFSWGPFGGHHGVSDNTTHSKYQLFEQACFEEPDLPNRIPHKTRENKHVPLARQASPLSDMGSYVHRPVLQGYPIKSHSHVDGLNALTKKRAGGGRAQASSLSHLYFCAVCQGMLGLELFAHSWVFRSTTKS